MYTSTYNPNRQYLFLVRQITLFKQRWIIAAAAVFGLLLLSSLATAYLNPDKLMNMLIVYAFVFFIGGLIFSSQVFMELNSPNQAYSFLTLPVSTLEKLFGSWLLTTPLYILVYTFVTYTIYLLSTLITGFAISPFEHFGWEAYFELIGAYLVIQTIFLWGACYFKKNNFLKTVLSLIVFVSALCLWGVFLVWVLFGEQRELSVTPSETQEAINSFLEAWLAPTLEFLFWGVLGPFMLLISYFTLKEREL